MGHTLHLPIGRGLIVRLAAVLFQGIFRGDGAAIRIGVEEKERLEMFFHTLADHIFPPGANLQQEKTQCLKCISKHVNISL